MSCRRSTLGCEGEDGVRGRVKYIGHYILGEMVMVIVMAESGLSMDV